MIDDELVNSTWEARLGTIDKSNITSIDKKRNKAGKSGRKSSMSAIHYKEMIWSSLSRRGFKCPTEVFEKMEEDDSLLVWTDDLACIIFMGDILSYMGYSLHELIGAKWDDLYLIDPKVGEQIRVAANECLTTGAIVENVTEWFRSCEKTSSLRHCYDLKFSLFAKYTGPGNSSGIFVLVKTRNLKKNWFRIVLQRLRGQHKLKR